MRESPDKDILRLARQDLVAMPGYASVEPPEILAKRLGIPEERIVKLDGNENPYGSSTKVREALASFPRYHIYPDPEQRRMREAIAEYVGADPDRIVVGNGSDELLDLTGRLFLSPGDGVVNAPPTFGIYEFVARTYGAQVVEVPRREDFALDLEPMEKALAAGAKLIFLASPNNPTGNRFAEEAIGALIEADRAIVVIDEAYGEFAASSLAGHIEHHPHVVVLRSCSKMGLAGLRLGTLIAADPVVAALEKARLPYNVNSFTQAAVRLVLEHREALEEQIEAVRAERGRLFGALEAQAGVTPYPSEANFVLFGVDEVDARGVHERLLEAGVLVRYFGGPGRLGRLLRVTVGRPEENEAFVVALAAALKTDV